MGDGQDRFAVLTVLPSAFLYQTSDLVSPSARRRLPCGASGGLGNDSVSVSANCVSWRGATSTSPVKRSQRDLRSKCGSRYPGVPGLTPTLERGEFEPLSPVTLGLLDDLFYSVDYDAADGYNAQSPPGSVMGSPMGALCAAPISGDLLQAGGIGFSVGAMRTPEGGADGSRGLGSGLDRRQGL